MCAILQYYNIYDNILCPKRSILSLLELLPLEGMLSITVAEKWPNEVKGSVALSWNMNILDNIYNPGLNFET